MIEFSQIFLEPLDLLCGSLCFEQSISETNPFKTKDSKFAKIEYVDLIFRILAGFTNQYFLSYKRFARQGTHSSLEETFTQISVNRTELKSPNPSKKFASKYEP